MTHTLAANLGSCNLNAASVADYALIANPFILTAMAFPVLLRAEYALAEKTVLFRL